MTTTLSLKLPPEVAKIMPWILAAKATKDPKQTAWAKEQYEAALERVRQREEWEREREERRLGREHWAKLAHEQEERERQAEQEELRRLQEKWDQSRVHVYRFEPEGYEVVPNGCYEEYLPPHGGGISSFRHFVSELKDAREPPPDWRRYSWGHYWRQGKRDKKRNRGQKPRTFRDYR